MANCGLLQTFCYPTCPSVGLLSYMLIVLSTHLAFAQTGDKERILFVGNSYTYFWNLPQQINTMAEESGLHLHAFQSTSGGANMGHHWRGERDLKTREIIATGQYDAIVFQGHSMSTIEYRDSLLHYASALADEIPSDVVKRYVYMTWAREWNPIMQDTIVEGYEDLAAAIGAEVVPVGLAWQMARQLRPDIQLYDVDGSHPSALGTYLTACVFYGALTGQSPVGLPHRLVTNDKDGEVLYLNIQSRGMAEFCQRVAQATLQKYEMN